MFRLNDYFYYHLLYGGTDIDPYSEIIANLKVHNHYRSSKGEILYNSSSSESNDDSDTSFVPFDPNEVDYEFFDLK